MFLFCHAKSCHQSEPKIRFLLKVTLVQRLKIDLNYFSGEILCWCWYPVLAEWSKMALKCHNKLIPGNVLIYCMKLQQHKGQKLGKIILTKSLFCGLSGKKGRKWV